MGLLLVAGRVVVANLLLLWFRRRHAETRSTVLVSQVERVAARLGLHRRVRILEGARLSGPVAFGVFRPTLALPASFTDDFDAAQQEGMLAHELAHLAARDPCWHLLADLLSALWWWHPLVWWARHQLNSASEAAADEASLIVADGPGVLASCLVALGAQLVERGQPGWLRMAGSGFRSASAGASSASCN
jgi:beta-lactamase regulating signal transducer with metallopeptidase domain